jgi:peptidoglycan/xylan/chitin deacetylase (PgdA/CDA1 family)
MGGRHGSGKLIPALLAGGAALAIAQGAPGLTALAPVRRLFPRLAGAGRPDQVALTFDDGPDPRFTPRLLATLDARRIRATFFLLGPMVQAAPGLAAEIASAGHEIAVHGWEHRYATVRGARGAARRSGPGLRHDRGGDRCRAPAVPAAVRGAQRHRPDCGPPPGVAARPVDYLGTGVGPGGHSRFSAGDPG